VREVSQMLHDKVREKKVEEGLELIIHHLDDSWAIWPRWISCSRVIAKVGIENTITKERTSRLVRSKQEALAWFKAANFLDCRISAYPYHIDPSKIDTAPSLLLVDIDREHSDTTEEFELYAAQTLKNFKELLDAQPTQLWTGNGYHFIQPQFAIILEKIERFKKFDKPSRRFLQFEEELLTDGKADQNHSRTVSFKNCYLRIPGSLNSNQLRFTMNLDLLFW
jgi:hypothetical protein